MRTKKHKTSFIMPLIAALLMLFSAAPALAAEVTYTTDNDTGTVSVDVEDDKKTPTIKLYKFGIKGKDNNPLENVEFMLSYMGTDDTGDSAASVTAVTDKNGNITFLSNDNKQIYYKEGAEYALKETSTQDGYILNTEIYHFIIKENHPAKNQFEIQVWTEDNGNVSEKQTLNLEKDGKSSTGLGKAKISITGWAKGSDASVNFDIENDWRGYYTENPLALTGGQMLLIAAVLVIALIGYGCVRRKNKKGQTKGQTKEGENSEQ